MTVIEYRWGVYLCSMSQSLILGAKGSEVVLYGKSVHGTNGLANDQNPFFFLIVIAVYKYFLFSNVKYKSVKYTENSKAISE